MRKKAVVDVESYVNLRTRGYVGKDEFAMLVDAPAISGWAVVRGFPLPVADLPAAIERYEAHRNPPRGHWSSRQLANRLGVRLQAVLTAVRDGYLTPDVRRKQRSDCFAFRKDRIQEYIDRWRSRHEAPRTSAPGTVVITPSGMIRPRVAPDVRVLAPLILARRNASSQRGFLAKRRVAKVEDLLASPSRRPSMPIFQSMSVHGVLTLHGRRTLQRT